MSNNLIYYIIIEGPSGIMACYKIANDNPDLATLLLKTKKHSLIIKMLDIIIFNWQQAQNDSDQQYAFQSDSKSIWMGISRRNTL